MISVIRRAALGGVLLGAIGLAGAAAGAQAGQAELPVCLAAANWSNKPVPGEDLWSAGGPGGATVGVKTNEGRLALLTVSALDTLVIQRLQLFDSSGKPLSVKEYVNVPRSTSLDVDTGTASTDSKADIKWNSGPPAGQSLEPVNDALVYGCRPSDRRPTPR